MFRTKRNRQQEREPTPTINQRIYRMEWKTQRIRLRDTLPYIHVHVCVSVAIRSIALPKQQERLWFRRCLLLKNAHKTVKARWFVMNVRVAFMLQLFVWRIQATTRWRIETKTQHEQNAMHMIRHCGTLWVVWAYSDIICSTRLLLLWMNMIHFLLWFDFLRFFFYAKKVPRNSHSLFCFLYKVFHMQIKFKNALIFLWCGNGHSWCDFQSGSYIFISYSL